MTILLLISALLPALILCIYVFKKDRVEKEPFSLLLKLFVLGVVSCLPVIAVSAPLCDAIDLRFYAETGIDLYIYQFIENFIGIALIEELGKLVFLMLGSARNKNFNSLFDGVIYSVFVSLGFAAFENILYVFDGGLAVALLRALLSVPGHMFFGVLMGYYYSLWHISGKAKKIEKQLQRNKELPQKKPVSRKGYLLMCLIAPTLAHGAYDFCCSTDGLLMFGLFIALELFLYNYCFKKINSLSKNDGDTHDYALLMLIEKYPEQKEIFIQMNTTEE